MAEGAVATYTRRLVHSQHRSDRTEIGDCQQFLQPRLLGHDDRGELAAIPLAPRPRILLAVKAPMPHSWVRVVEATLTVEILGRVVRPNAESVAADRLGQRPTGDPRRGADHRCSRACELPDGPETVGKVVLWIR
jgi:hypothetical protein